LPQEGRGQSKLEYYQSITINLCWLQEEVAAGKTGAEWVRVLPEHHNIPLLALGGSCRRKAPGTEWVSIMRASQYTVERSNIEQVINFKVKLKILRDVL
jgi:hypothetical protein